MTERMPQDDPEQLEGAAERLAREIGAAGSVRLFPLPGGGNNRVFRLEAGGFRGLLKAYFRHPDDPRDRLGAEFGFSTFAWSHGVRAIPRPLAQDRERGLGLYEFVEGRRPVPGEASADWVDQAIDFFLAVNRHRETPEALRLPDASEACSSLGEHLSLVEARVRRLDGICGDSAVDLEAIRFARESLLPAWIRLASRFRREAARRGFSLAETLEPAARRISPSDFGYHNAILTGDGALRFVDFEYAGWDDPAKTICDFICQPAVPAPVTALDRFTASILEDCPRPERHRQAVSLLLPLYRVKWCCIMLNEFQPAGKARRQFAEGESSRQDRAEAQLDKARRSLEFLLAEGME